MRYKHITSYGVVVLHSVAQLKFDLPDVQCPCSVVLDPEASGYLCNTLRKPSKAVETRRRTVDHHIDSLRLEKIEGIVPQNEVLK